MLDLFEVMGQVLKEVLNLINFHLLQCRIRTISNVFKHWYIICEQGKLLLAVRKSALTFDLYRCLQWRMGKLQSNTKSRVYRRISEFHLCICNPWIRNLKRFCYCALGFEIYRLNANGPLRLLGGLTNKQRPKIGYPIFIEFKCVLCWSVSKYSHPRSMITKSESRHLIKGRVNLPFFESMWSPQTWYSRGSLPVVNTRFPSKSPSSMSLPCSSTSDLRIEILTCKAFFHQLVV